MPVDYDLALQEPETMLKRSARRVRFSQGDRWFCRW